MLKRLAPEAVVELTHRNSQVMLEFPHADMVHVDADHTYFGAMADICKAFAAVNPGGVVVVDDYTFYKDVGKAVDDFVKANAAAIEKVDFVKSLRGDFLIWKKGLEPEGSVEIEQPMLV